MKYLWLFVCCFSYAIVRYNVFGDVHPSHIPSFIFNKAVAFSAIFALLFAALAGRRSKPVESRNWFSFFKAATAVHILLSLAMMSPIYYPKIFQDGRLSFFGELALLFGVLGIFMFWSKKIVEYDSPATLEWIKLGAIAALALHQLFLGLFGWLKPQGWSAYGYMPPITLVSFTVIVAILVLQIMEIRKRTFAFAASRDNGNKANDRT